MRRQNPSRICSRHGLALSASSGGMEKSKKRREERREKRAHGRKLESLHFYGVPWPPQRSSKNHKRPPKIFTAYLRCPVTTSKSSQKLFSSLLPKVCKAEVASKRLAKQIRSIFTVFRDHVVEGRKVKKKAFEVDRLFRKAVFCFEVVLGWPEGRPQARLYPFLQGEIRRPESLHIYSVPGTFAQNPL